ncbi:MAG: hypothetical protein JWQ49_4692 [Edaphobacter sp.]|nr:hypothetical protein [Edaphobacter sp.]
MRLPCLLVIAAVLAAPTLTCADTILVGSDLYLVAGSGLCPSFSDCEEVAQQVTFFTPVVIDQVKVGISGPNRTGIAAGNFNVVLGHTLGGGTQIGSGNLIFDPNGPLIPGIFTFSGLNISLPAGTYYLQLSGGNVQWDFGEPLITTTGTIGPSWICDPTISCAHWGSAENIHAFDIYGTATTPEPSTFALLATGIVVLAGASRRWLYSHS